MSLEARSTSSSERPLSHKIPNWRRTETYRALRSRIREEIVYELIQKTKGDRDSVEKMLVRDAQGEGDFTRMLQKRTDDAFRREHPELLLSEVDIPMVEVIEVPDEPTHHGQGDQTASVIGEVYEIGKMASIDDYKKGRHLEEGGEGEGHRAA